MQGPWQHLSCYTSKHKLVGSRTREVLTRHRVATSVCPKRDNRINALLVTVCKVRVADVISTASSKVTVISNVPVSSISRVQSIEIGCAEPKESAKLRIQTKISGCASGLSLPDDHQFQLF